MDSLLELDAGRPSIAPTGADALFRSPSSAQMVPRRSAAGPADPCDDPCAPNLEAPRTTTRRTIALAKAILTEACTSTRLSQTMPSAATSSPLGSVLVLLKSAATAEKACACMTTLSFLLLDRSNRKAVAELGCVEAMLDAIRAYPDPQVHLAALDTIVAVVRHDNTEKSRLWQRDAEGTIVSLVNLRHSPQHLLQLLRLLRAAAFCTDGANGPVQLLEPGLVPAIASLLHPSSDAEVLQAALRFLHTAAHCSQASHLPAWHPALFGIVPLLHASGAPASACGDTGPAQGVPGCPRCTLDAALQPLLCLSDHDAFHNALFAAGCLRPLLPLLGHPADRIKVAATCILANLVESSLCREQLASNAAILAMLDSLYVASCTEATVGLLYILGRLAGSQPHVIAVLRQHASAPLTVMMQCNPGDKDVLLGLQQLLELMQGAPDEGGSSSGDVSRSSSGVSDDMSATMVLRAVDSEVQLSSIAGQRSKQCQGTRLSQVASSSGIVNLCAINWL